MNLSRPLWKVFILLMVLMLPLYFGFLGNCLVNGHDALANLIRAYCMDQYIGDRQFLVRWVSNVNGGFGSPIFEFYPPFFYYISVFISKIIHNVLLSLNLTCVILWILSGWGMYLLAREFWGNKGGFLSAVAYVYAPYYIQNIYVRGAFSESSTFAFFPFLILSLYKINQKIRVPFILLGAGSVFALTLTHTMGMFFLPIAAVYVLFLFLINKNVEFCWLGFLILVAGWMMSSFFWLPALWETKYLNLKFLISMRYSFYNNFYFLKHLFRLPWDHSIDLDGLSFQIGFLHLLFALFPLVFFLKKFTQDFRRAAHYFLFLALGFVVILLILPVSQVLWANVNVLRFIQFPWRFLTIFTFIISFLAGSMVLLFRKQSTFFSVVSISLIILFSFGFWGPGHFKKINQSIDLSRDVIFLGEGQPTPVWIETPPNFDVASQKFFIVRGDGELSQYKSDSSIEHVVHVHANQPLFLCFKSFYFPGWRVYMDNKEIKIYPNNPYGFILFIVPAGEHMLKVTFGATTIRLIAVMVSWLGVGLLIFSLGILKFKKII